MNKLLLCTVLAVLFPALCAAQGKNAIRVGGGVKLENSETRIHAGPCILFGYTRELNKWLSSEINVSAEYVSFSKENHESDLNIVGQVMVSPLAKWFRNLELGVGLGASFRQYVYFAGKMVPKSEAFDSYWVSLPEEDGNSGRNIRETQFCVNYCVRLYAIRSKRFDLYGFYNLNTKLIPKKELVYLSSSVSAYYIANANVGISFGVKF